MGGIGGDSVITYMKVMSKALFLKLAERHTGFKAFRFPINFILRLYLADSKQKKSKLRKFTVCVFVIIQT